MCLFRDLISGPTVPSRTTRSRRPSIAASAIRSTVLQACPNGRAKAHDDPNGPERTAVRHASASSGFDVSRKHVSRGSVNDVENIQPAHARLKAAGTPPIVRGSPKDSASWTGIENDLSLRIRRVGAIPPSGLGSRWVAPTRHYWALPISAPERTGDRLRYEADVSCGLEIIVSGKTPGGPGHATDP
jgi:hypothetical protein